MLSADGLFMSDRRKEALANTPIPANKKDLQRFLGVTNYFHKFIEDYGSITAPLTRLTGSTQVFEWNDAANQAFCELIQRVLSAPFLYFIDYNLPVVLRVDASMTGVGGVLLNVKDGQERFIEFASKIFSTAAQKWSTYEQEAYAIYYCILKFAHYLTGHPFILETDHRNLIWLDQSATPKVVRWRLRLQEFDIRLSILQVTRILLQMRYRDSLAPDLGSQSCRQLKTSKYQIVTYT